MIDLNESEVRDVSGVALTGLTDAQRQRAMTRFEILRHWRKLGVDLDGDDFTDAQAVAAVARITSGNSRLLQRLFAQIQRIMKINDLHTITADVVETVRSTLVIGAT